MSAQVTTREIATTCGVSLRTAQRWAQNGKLSATKQCGRWVITVPAALDSYKPSQLDKAAELIEQGGLVPTTLPGRYTAVSSDGTVNYLVTITSCTCQAGQRDIRCYHRAAATLAEAARTSLRRRWHAA
jgi:hypothetical protein